MLKIFWMNHNTETIDVFEMQAYAYYQVKYLNFIDSLTNGV